jgi:hypothetical protein
MSDIGVKTQTKIAPEREFPRVVAQETASKGISGVADNKAGVRSIVKLRIGRNAFLESLCCAISEVLHGQGSAVLLDRVVHIHEEVHIHRGGIAGSVQVIAGIG